jgi:DNA replication protein DnaC
MSQTCPLCHDGWILLEDENGSLVARECDCRKERVKNSRLKFANIPESFKDMELKTFRTDVYRLKKSKEDINIVVGIIKAYLNELDTQKAQGMGLYIFSSTKGSGKTRLAASISNELLKKYNMQVKFAVSTAIINEIKKTWDKKSEYTESKLLYDLGNTEVLVIDDFGTEDIKGWINERFYSIINDRYINKKITIFTSNYALSDLKYDDRITNRIKERTYQLPFPEESVREYIAEKNNADMINKLGGK